MQTELADFIKDTSEGRQADAILRKCVHCGFCTATCPTYQLLGNELDGPRGRIYLIKQVLEGDAPGKRTQLHLDRCLTCRSCETTCPSGVQYAQLLEIGRDVIEQRVSRGILEKIVRKLLCLYIPNIALLRMTIPFGQLMRKFLPKSLRTRVPPREPNIAWPQKTHSKKAVIHQGCVQRVVKPAINQGAVKLLGSQNVTAIRCNDGCCGALALHLGNRNLAMQHARRNIDVWLPEIENGAEQIISTASGCGVMIKEYPELFINNPEYLKKAEMISSRTIDISEVEIVNESAFKLDVAPARVAFHSPCTLQHGQKLPGKVEAMLKKLGVEALPVENAHLCCGSAGTYSILQPKIANQLLENKLKSLENSEPELILTANIGCLLHLQSKSRVPVKHWVELFNSK